MNDANWIFTSGFKDAIPHDENNRRFMTLFPKLLPTKEPQPIGSPLLLNLIKRVPHDQH